MKGALKGKIAELSSGDAMDYDFPEDGPSPPEGPSSPPPQIAASRHSQGHQDRYQYLCLLVGGQKDVADRLIEHERSGAPTASQDELIERAIERLLRQRR